MICQTDSMYAIKRISRTRNASLPYESVSCDLHIVGDAETIDTELLLPVAQLRLKMDGRTQYV